MGWAKFRAKDIFSFNVQTKPSSSTQFVSLPFLLYTSSEALSTALSVVAQAIARNKQANQANEKNSSLRAFYEFLLLSYCLGSSAELV